MDKIRIVIADDEKMIRDGLKIILEAYQDIDVVATASDGLNALEEVRRTNPDLVLMDIRMPNIDGVKATRLIKDEFIKVKILILTTFTDTEYIRQALEYGASGYLLKDSDYDVIHEGILAALKGTVVVHPEIATRMISDLNKNKRKDINKFMSDNDLSERDINIIRKISEGLSNREISELMFLSEGTVKNIVSNILAKLELRDRNQLTAFCYRNNLIDN